MCHLTPLLGGEHMITTWNSIAGAIGSQKRIMRSQLSSDCLYLCIQRHGRALLDEGRDLYLVSTVRFCMNVPMCFICLSVAYLIPLCIDTCQVDVFEIVAVNPG